jgi:hypothetical protein
MQGDDPSSADINHPDYVQQESRSNQLDFYRQQRRLMFEKQK